MTHPPLIVVAHALAPGPGGAEAEVNANLLRALIDHWRAPLTVITASGSSHLAEEAGARRGDVAVHALGECGELTARPSLGSRTAAWCLGRLRRGGPGQGIARLVNHVSYRVTGQGVKRAWTQSAARVLAREVASQPGAVVYSRALPLASIEAVAAVRRQTSWPWIVNINDPMPAALLPGQYAIDARGDRRTRRVLDRIVPQVSAFTFPSEGLREVEHACFPRMAGVPNLVLPHVAPPPAATPDERRGEASPAGALHIAFVGTLRSNRVRQEFFDGCARVVAGPHVPLHLSFVVPVVNTKLARAQQDLPDIVHVTASPSSGAIEAAVAGADVLLDLESDGDAPLLLAKLARYAAARRPVWAVCAPGGTTARLLREQRWGYVSHLGDADSVADTLRAISADWTAGRLPRRAATADALQYFSGARIVGELARLCATLTSRAAQSGPVPQTHARPQEVVAR